MYTIYTVSPNMSTGAWWVDVVLLVASNCTQAVAANHYLFLTTGCCCTAAGSCEAATVGNLHRGSMQEAASFDHLPAHLQTYILGLATVPLLTCKASAAIVADPALLAYWFIGNKQSPFLAAALAQQWDACWHMLDSWYQPSEWQIVAAVDAAAAHGQLELVQVLLERGAADMLRGFDRSGYFEVRASMPPYVSLLSLCYSET
jgi:hypothetical protein